METIKKYNTLPVHRVNEEDRKIQFIISDERKDRHGTIIKVDGWDLEDFNRNGIVGYMHEVHGDWLKSADPDQVIGIGRAFVEDGKVIGEVEFEPAEINEKADKIFKKVKFGSLRATSVGFAPSEGHWGQERDNEDPNTYYFTKQSLLEFSIVNIPSNANALKRDASDQITKYLEEHKKPEKDIIDLKKEQKEMPTGIKHRGLELSLKKKLVV